jgi:hypothetical protein
LSKDELQLLLGELSLKSPKGSRLLNQLEKIDGEKKILELRLQETQKRHERWTVDKACLEQFIEEEDVNNVLSNIPLAKKLLDGDIDLEHPKQSHALAELAVTLSEQDIDPSIPRAARAIHLYYQEYFFSDRPPEKLDSEAKKAMEDFWEDPGRGSHESFSSYLDHLKQLDLFCEAGAPLADTMPSYAAALHLKKMLAQPKEPWILELLNKTEWDLTHNNSLRDLFFAVQTQSVAEGIFATIEQLEEDNLASFLEKVLKADHFPQIVHNKLKAMEHQQMLHLQERCLKENLNFLLASVNNLIGIDKPGFYRALEKTQLPTEVFGKIVRDLFTPRQTTSGYGIDTLHLHRVLEQQKHLPQNLAVLLQQALPGGIEGRAIATALVFFKGLTKQLLEQRERLLPLERGSAEQAKLLKEISELDSVRFLLVSHIQDRIRSCRAAPRATGMTEIELREQLHDIYREELTKGGNANIKTALEFLYKTFPNLAPLPNTDPTP